MEAIVNTNALSTDELVKVVSISDEIVELNSKAKEELQRRAEAGETIKGYHLERKSTKAVVTDPAGLMDELISQGYERSAITEIKLKSMTCIKKLVGTKMYESLMSKYSEKPVGSFKLIKDVALGEVENNSEVLKLFSSVIKTKEREDL